MFSNYKNACKTHCVKQTLPFQKKKKKNGVHKNLSNLNWFTNTYLKLLNGNFE